jgi:hypothetical protein
MFIDFFDMPRLIHFLIEIITIGAPLHSDRTRHDTRAHTPTAHDTR